MYKTIGLRSLACKFNDKSVPIKVLLIILFLLIGLSPILASAMGSGQYTVDRLMSDQGGVRTSSPSYTAYAVLGAGNEAGASLSTNSKLQGGFITAFDNMLPKLINPIASQSWNGSGSKSFQFPVNTFSDPDNNTLTYTATQQGGAALPSWLSFDSATRTFSGNPPNGVPTLNLTVTANDGNGGTINNAFALNITNANDPPTGSLTITGTVTQGEILTAVSTLADADGMGTLSYQWKANGESITGATGNTLLVAEAQVGKTITVVASYADGSNTVESVTSSATTQVVNVNDVPIGTVTINGSATKGQFLTANTLNLSDADGLGVFNYQWKADSSVITGATGASLQLTGDHVGMVITVVVNYTDGHGKSESVISSATSPVVNVNDPPIGNVTLTGTPTQGQTLTATNTLTDGDGMGIVTYQWKADNLLISGATGATLTLTESLVGKAIIAEASYTDGHNTIEKVSSAATNPVANLNDPPTGSVTITGTVTQGQTLTASNTLADADGMGNVVSYQWKADGVAIGGATSSSLLLTEAQVGKVISVVASYTDGHNTGENRTSAETIAVVNVNDPPTGSVTIPGQGEACIQVIGQICGPTQGQTLSVTNTLADLDGMGTVSYQWKVNAGSISGATGNTLLLTEALVGKTITVTASYADGHGTQESVSSSTTLPVVNSNDPPIGSVTITGTPTQGQTLTAANTLTDGDGMGVVTYQWKADGSSISGATSSTLLLIETHVGKTITVTASYTDGHGTAENATSIATNLVTNLNDLPTGSVMITGTATKGQHLTANTLTLLDLDGLGVFTYQWKANGAIINGAISSTYLLTGAEVGKMITVTASYTDGHNTQESVTGASIGPVSDFNNPSIGTVTITGTATQGRTLTATNNLSDLDGIGTVSYQWHADGAAISGATAATLTLNQALVGKIITVTASYIDGFNTKESVASSATIAVLNINDLPSGSVTLSGTPTQGQILTVANTLADADGMGVVTYQWKENGIAINGATGATLTLNEVQVGKIITVTANYTDGHGTAENVTSTATTPVINVNDPPSGGVTLSGKAIQGQTLTVVNTLMDLDGMGVVSYQWKADGDVITGATGNSLTLTENLVEKTITVTASYTDGHGTQENVIGSATNQVVNVNDLPTGSVTITGTPTQGQILTSTNTLADPDGMGTVNYQWKADDSPINGANSSTLLLTQAQVGKIISVLASYTDGHGTLESMPSNASSTVMNVNDTPTGSVGIVGTAKTGQTLTVNTLDLVDPDGPGAYSYQWKANGVVIGSATANTYLLTGLDLGKVITVTVSYTDGHGTAESVTSSATSPVVDANASPTGSVTITGTTTQGHILTVTNTLADLDGMGPVSYQWKSGSQSIPGATASSLILTKNLVGKTIMVVASYIDSKGVQESVASSATGTVVNVNDPPTGSVTISGIPTKDNVLTVANTLADADGLGVFSYQWKVDGVAINGAIGNTLTLTQSYYGHSIAVVASYTDGHGTQESVISNILIGISPPQEPPTGSVTITGTPTQGETLTATNTLADADGMGVVTYQWKADGSLIHGATSNTFILTEAQVGKAITVTASYTDGHGTAESMTSVASIPVVNLNDVPSGSVVVSGKLIQGQTLTVTHTLADLDGMGIVSYQWKADGLAINKATGNTLLLTEAQVGKAITAEANYTDGHGTIENVISTATSKVENLNDTPTGSVVIIGTATKGQSLHANTQGLSDADGLGTFNYQWNANGKALIGATKENYLLTEAEVGAVMTVMVSYTDGHSTQESLTSSATSQVTAFNSIPTGRVTITGTAIQGNTLIAANTLIDADGMGSISYQWKADGVTIIGVTGTTLVLTESLVRKVITVFASYTDGHGVAESVPSTATDAVININDPPAGFVIITGTAIQGQNLAATNTLADADGIDTVNYQWKADGVAISGATGSTFVLTEAQVGKIVTVEARFTDGYGTKESVTSSMFGPVINLNDLPGGAVTITGTATQGETLTASNTLTDLDGMGTVHYQWKANDLVIPGATGSSLILTESLVGQIMTVEVSYTDGHATKERAISPATKAVSNVNDSPNGSVTIAGRPIKGQLLTANTVALADLDGLGAFNYQWQEDGKAINGATGRTHLLIKEAVGKTISVEINYIDGHGTPEKVTSSATSAVVDFNNPPTGSVTLTGLATQGKTLTVSTTLADTDGLGPISYQWKANDKTISGATADTLILTKNLVGTIITVTASYTDGQGFLESVTSQSTSSVVNVNDLPTGGVTITGSAIQGQTLTAGNTLADADGLGAVHYQWKADGSVIGGVTGNTLILTGNLVGKVITVTASYTDDYGWLESVVSNPTSAVIIPNKVPSATQHLTITTRAGTSGSVDLTGTDSNGDPLTFTIESLPAHGTLYQTQDGTTKGSAITTVGTKVTNAQGRVIHVPNSDWSGTDTFNFAVSDGQGISDFTPVTILINPGKKPEIAPIANQTMVLGQTPITVPFTVLNQESAIGAVTFATKSLNAEIIPDANIQVVNDGNRFKVVITPIANKTGSCVITLTLKDEVDSFTIPFTLIVEDLPQIAGVVTNGAGVGVADVLVHLHPEGSDGIFAETFTDAKGNYSFKAMLGAYRVEFMTSYLKEGKRVTLPGNFINGFANGTGGMIDTWDGAKVVQLTKVTQMDAALSTGMILSGTVQKIDGTPVPGAEINVHNKDWTQFVHTKANSEGVFSVIVNPGKYQVEIWPAHCEATNTAADQGCGTGQVTFQGGNWITPQDSSWVSGWKADDHTTQPVVVVSTAGTNVIGTVMAVSDDHMLTNIKMDQSLSIKVFVDSGIPIQGRVVDAANAGVADAWVNSPFGGGPTDQNGYFTLYLPSNTANSGLATFDLHVFPSGHEDPKTHVWVQGTRFIGGVVTGDPTHGFLLSGDETQATQFKSVAAEWPAMALGDNIKTGLLVRVTSGIVITGTIQNDAGKKLENIWVNAWSHDTSFGEGAASNSEGVYSILVPIPATGTTVWYEMNLWSDRYLVPDPVLVKVQSNGVVGVYKIDKSQAIEDNSGLFKPVASTAIKEDANGKVPVEFIVSTGNTISGRVADANNKGLPWTWVDIHTKDGSKWYGANTDENGFYSLTVAPASNYVGVVWGLQGHYQTTYYKNAFKEDTATLIDASGDKKPKHIDFGMNPGAKISGTIVGPMGKKIWLTVWSESENIMGGVEVIGKGTTPVHFDISGLGQADDFKLDWHSNSDEIPGGFYGGVPGSNTPSGPQSWERATLLSTMNGNLTGVAIDLTADNSKTLTVKITGLTPNAKVDANLWSAKLDTGRWKQAKADATGVATMALKGVDPKGDDYQLFIGGPDATFKQGHFKGEVNATAYSGTAGTLVASERATLINMSTDQFVYVTVSSGRQLTVSVAGLKKGQKVWVDAYSENTGAQRGGEVKYVDGTTDKVVIKGLEAADDYRVSIWGDTIQGGSYAGNGKTPGDWNSAEQVDLTAGDVSISLAVSSGRSIAGTVNGLQAKEIARIDAWSNSTYSWGGSTLRASGSGSDSYSIAGVGQAADFEVNFNAEGYLTQSKSDVNTSTQDATGVNFAVSKGGSITGTITGLNAYEWVRMDAWSLGKDHVIADGVSADAKGVATYTLTGLPTAEDYVVGLWRGNKGLFYTNSGVTTVWDKHTPVAVTGSEVTKSIHFDLTTTENLFYTLSGTVSGLTSDQVVDINAWSTTAGASASIIGNGTYTLEGLPAGKYTVEVTSNGYAPQHTASVTVSGGVVSNVIWSTGWNNSGTVEVIKNTTGLNVIVSKGYFIKGTVTKSGTAVNGVTVNALSKTDQIRGSAVTNSKGEFMIKGLPNSIYQVDVWTPDGTATKEVTMNGSNQMDVVLLISKAGGSIKGTVKNSKSVEGNAMVIAYDSQGVEKDRFVADAKTGAYTLDGLNIDELYTVKAFSAAKAKAGNWTTDTGYATGTTAATSAGATLDLILNDASKTVLDNLPGCPSSNRICTAEYAPVCATNQLNGNQCRASNACQIPDGWVKCL